jgi:arginine-tRNA-protein transferase
MAYFDGERLVAIGLVDVTPNALSSIYFFYHPDVAAISVGVASVLFEIEWARRLGCTHLYLGYRIIGCPSTAYKGQYGPHELLQGRPEGNDAAVWV